MNGVKKKIREVEALKVTDVKETLYGDWRGRTPGRNSYNQEDRFQQDGKRTQIRKQSLPRNRSNSRNRSRSQYNRNMKMMETSKADRFGLLREH